MRAFARHVFAVLVAGAAAHAFALTAPNVVAISDRLVTAGQPSREALAALSAEAFQAVIYLAPSTVFDAVKDEPEIVARQGIEFVHIPIPFGAPTAAHADALAAALDRLKGKKVLVHCQVNMRASTLVFLYRTLHLREDPAHAWESVARVWVPQGPWKELVRQQLAARGIPFDPF